MRKTMAMLVGVAVLSLVVGIGGAWAEGKVTVTREENKPKDVEVKAGEEVRFVNSSGQTVHVWFGGNDAVRFYVPAGSSGAKVKFDKPGHLRVLRARHGREGALAHGHGDREVAG